MQLSPVMTRRDMSPQVLTDHVKALTQKKKVEPPSHLIILDKLLDQIEWIDFKALAFPKAAELKEILNDLEKQPKSESNDEKIAEIQETLESFKVAAKHYLVLSIENVLEVANRNKWGLCKNNLFIHIYNGEYWNEVDKQAMQSFLSKSAVKMSVPKFDAKLASFVRQLFEQFLCEAYLPKPEPPKGKVLVNLMNGTFEVSTSKPKLRQFDRLDFLTYQLPFEYDKDAQAPLFHTFLSKVLPDVQKQNILAEYLGYVFTHSGTLKLEKTLLLYGTGANGKSVFFEIVSALLGEGNVSNYSLQSLTDSTGYFRAKLSHKLVNYASEINGKLEASVFKQLVSGEPVEARLPYGEPFILKDYAKLIFNCNELPKSPEHTHAYFRRFLIIPFDVTIPDSEQDKRLSSKIIASELSGVFNWVLEGLSRLIDQGKFSPCEASEKALNIYKEESDSVNMFLKEKCYERSAVDRIDMKKLFSEYKDFCHEDNYRPVGRPNFSLRLGALGIIFQRMNTGNVAFLRWAGAVPV